jgi:hypothetical protein
MKSRASQWVCFVIALPGHQFAPEAAFCEPEELRRETRLSENIRPTPPVASPKLKREIATVTALKCQ